MIMKKDSQDRIETENARNKTRLKQFLPTSEIAMSYKHKAERKNSHSLTRFIIKTIDTLSNLFILFLKLKT